MSKIISDEEAYKYRFALERQETVSYAQNAEDVVLSRIFGQKEAGFYVDVGAANPNINSVTKYFYLKDWNGINIEPVKEFFHLLVLDRPRDINLNIGISNKPGISNFYECKSVKEWSTFSSKIFSMHQKHGVKFIKRKVKIDSLANIFNKYAKQTIDFLKIDVEGYEQKVLKSNDWKKFRPSIIIVESNTHKHTKYFLEKENYIFALNDGLNQFYVSSEKKYYLNKLSYPANVRDNYIPAYYHQIINNFNDKEQDLHAKFQQQYSLVDSELKKTQMAYQEAISREQEVHKKFQHEYSLIDSELKKTFKAYHELFDVIRSYNSSVIFKIWQKYQKSKFKISSLLNIKKT